MHMPGLIPLLIVLALAFLLFSRPGRISGLMEDLGKGIRGFRKGIDLTGLVSSGHLVEDNRLDQNTHIGVAIEGGGSVLRRNVITDTGTGKSATWAHALQIGENVAVEHRFFGQAAELVHEEGGHRRLVLPAHARRIDEVDVPCHLGKVERLLVGLAELLPVEPELPHARVRQQ